MAKPIEINMLYNVSDVVRGAKDVDSAFDKVADSLDDLAKDAQRAGDKIEDGLVDGAKDGARKADDQLEKLERGFKELADTAKRESKQAGDALDTNVGKGMKSATGNVQEFRSEAVQNFSEVTSSFDGSMSSIVDLAQGTFGGLAAGIAGPIGLAAGGAAVAVGLIGAAIDGLGSSTEADQEKVGEWAQSYIEAGSTILTSAQSTAKVLEIIQDPEKFKEAEEAAKDWGVTTATAIAALSGQQWAINAVQSSLNGMNTELQAYADSGVGPTSENIGAWEDLGDQFDRGTDRFKKMTGEMDAGQKQANTYSQYLIELANNTDGATSSVDEFGDTITTLPDGKQIYIDAETGQATDQVDAITKKIYSVPSTTITVTADTTPFQNSINGILKGKYAVQIKSGNATNYGYGY